MAKRSAFCGIISLALYPFLPQANLSVASALAFCTALVVFVLLRRFMPLPYTEKEVSLYGLRRHLNRVSGVISLGMEDMSTVCAAINGIAALLSVFPHFPEGTVFFVQVWGIVFMLFWFVYILHNTGRLSRTRREILEEKTIPIEW